MLWMMWDDVNVFVMCVCCLGVCCVCVDGVDVVCVWFVLDFEWWGCVWMILGWWLCGVVCIDVVDVNDDWCGFNCICV